MRLSSATWPRVLAPNGALPSKACSTMPSRRSPSDRSCSSASALSTLRIRFSMRTPVCTRSISRGACPPRCFEWTIRCSSERCQVDSMMLSWYLGTNQARNGTTDARPTMEIGIFQLLPAPEALSDREVIEQALWEEDCAEAGGYGSVWITEHHLSSFGLVGAPSVYAAAVAQRTRRVRIGYAIAVLPLHHPLRLAEEIAWVGHLSNGRLLVGVGPGFSPYEFGA